jgi:hypothetical protein
MSKNKMHERDMYSLVLNWTESAFMWAFFYGSRMDVMDWRDNIFMYGRV